MQTLAALFVVTLFSLLLCVEQLGRCSTTKLAEVRRQEVDRRQVFASQSSNYARITERGLLVATFSVIKDMRCLRQLSCKQRTPIL